MPGSVRRSQVVKEPPAHGRAWRSTPIHTTADRKFPPINPPCPGRRFLILAAGCLIPPLNQSLPTPAFADPNRRASLQRSRLDYRHTFGSQLAMKGESLYKISTLMEFVGDLPTVLHSVVAGGDEGFGGI